MGTRGTCPRSRGPSGGWRAVMAKGSSCPQSFVRRPWGEGEFPRSTKERCHMLTVSKEQVHLVEGKPVLLAEASELGLAVGEWPDFVAVLDATQEGFLFQKG